jgi:hypothetical protein
MFTTSVTLTNPAVTNRTRKTNAGLSGLGNDTWTDEADFNSGIWRRAYQKWAAAGYPAGDGARFWKEAEREILEGK